MSHLPCVPARLASLAVFFGSWPGFSFYFSSVCFALVDVSRVSSNLSLGSDTLSSPMFSAFPESSHMYETCKEGSSVYRTVFLFAVFPSCPQCAPPRCSGCLGRRIWPCNLSPRMVWVLGIMVFVRVCSVLCNCLQPVSNCLVSAFGPSSVPLVSHVWVRCGCLRLHEFAFASQLPPTSHLFSTDLSFQWLWLPLVPMILLLFHWSPASPLGSKYVVGGVQCCWLDPMLLVESNDSALLVQLVHTCLPLVSGCWIILCLAAMHLGSVLF